MMTPLDRHPADPVIQERWPLPVPRLVNLRAGRHETFDRVVFDFDGVLPGYRIGYVDEVRAQGTGERIELCGEASLRVLIHPAKVTDSDGRLVYQGPKVACPWLPVLLQVYNDHHFEGTVLVALGLAAQTGFHVLTLSDPTRIAIDLPHPGDGGR